MAEQFSIEAFIFILILIIYVLTAHLIEVQKVLIAPSADPLPALVWSGHYHGLPDCALRLLRNHGVTKGLDGNIVFDN
jgi:hypothetical protein